MSRKQLFVDWNTLNQLIQAKDKKAIVMPGENLWDNEYAAEFGEKKLATPDWANPKLVQDIDAEFDQQMVNARDKMIRPEKQAYTDAEAEIGGFFRVEAIPDEKTVVVLVVKDLHNPHNNTQQHIHCQDGTGFCGYVRDMSKDSYIAECVDFLSLGNVHVSYRMSLPNTGGWTMRVPMPPAVLERLLSPYYKRALKEARAKYPNPRYELHFMQMIGCD